MSLESFQEWTVRQLLVSPRTLRHALVPVAFEVLAARVDLARVNGSAAPMRTLGSHTAGGNSRATTRSMLRQLGLPEAAQRTLLRLLAGSASGWPGLMTLYAHGEDLDAAQRRYARRQLRLIAAALGDSRRGPSTHSAPVPRLSTEHPADGDRPRHRR